MRITLDPAVAARAIADGHLAALPTETVYGLGARADLPRAIARVYAAKGRPADHPLIVHVLDPGSLRSWGTSIPAYASALADAFWPGPLTLVVTRSDRAADFVTGGQTTVAVRVPSHPGMRSVLAELAAITGDQHIGIAAPSANRFGRVSPTSVEHVVDELAGVLSDDDVILDGGRSQVGVESTIIDCSRTVPALLRPGHVSLEEIERVTGLTVGSASRVRAPGTLASHYAPRARVVIVDANELAAQQAPPNDATTGVIALADVTTPQGTVRLSAPPTSDDYARVLYSALREADSLGLATILAVPPSPGGVGEAVIDRLMRAAAAD